MYPRDDTKYIVQNGVWPM